MCYESDIISYNYNIFGERKGERKSLINKFQNNHIVYLNIYILDIMVELNM